MICASCGILLELHDLARARACLEAIAKAEPPTCRLTGPADPDAWARAVARRTIAQLADPERFEV